MDFGTLSPELSVPKVHLVYGGVQALHCECRQSPINGDAKSTYLSFKLANRAMGVPSATLYMVAYDHLLKVAVPAFISNPSLVPLTSGILARAAVSTLVSPLELLRTNLQATPLSPAHTQSLRSVSRDLRQLVRSQGTRALWRGLGPTLWRDVPFSGIYWSNYELVKKALHRNGYTGSLVSFISGATGGTIAAVLTSPFDVLKTRQQALVMSSRRGNQPATFALSLLSKIVQKEGIQVLFQGLSPRIAKIAPACGIMIACFEVGDTVGPQRSLFHQLDRVWGLISPVTRGRCSNRSWATRR